VSEFGRLEELVLEWLESERRAFIVFDHILTTMPTLDEAYEQYAEEMGRAPLTAAERRQAYISAVLRQTDGAIGGG